MTKILLSCILCRKETSTRGLAPHYWMRHGDGIALATVSANASRRGKPSWNTGKTLSKDHCAKISVGLTNKTLSEDSRKKISATAKKNGISGGFREGGGRGKKGKFQGIHCDSSWELAFLIDAHHRGRDVKRITTPRLYEFEGRPRKYFPDFLVDGQVVEIKGWKTTQWEAKHQQHSDVIVLGFEDIKPMIERAQQIYGEDFTVAYD